MANSIINDTLNNKTPKKSKNKGLKIFLLFMIFMLIIALILISVFLYLQTRKKVSPKDDFISFLEKVNVSDVLNLEKTSELGSKLKSEESEVTTDFTADMPGVLGDEVDLNETAVEINSKISPELKKQISEVSFKYKDNDIINFNILSSSDAVGVFSEDILTKYIGSKYSNLDKVLSSFLSENNEESLNRTSLDFSQLNGINFEFPKYLSKISLKNYLDVIKQKVPETSFSSKKVTLDRDLNKIDVTEYTMTLNEEKAIELLDQMLQTLEKDDELLDTCLSFIKDEKQKSSIKESFKNQIEVYINMLYQKTPDNTKKYVIKIYGDKDKTYKVIIDFASQGSIDIDYGFSEKENSLTINVLDVNQSGYSMDIKKTISDVSEKLDTTLNKVEKNDIVGKINIVSDLKNSGNSYTLKNTLDINFMFINLKAQLNNSINFNTVEVENLTKENCLFLDEQDTEEYTTVVKAVKDRTKEVINDNLVSQGVSPIINEHENITEEVPQENTTTIDREQLKEEAKNKLINGISEAMTKAQNEGRTYTLDDLVNLEIPNSTFTVSITENEAILDIDGFEFKLNSEFQLYE